MARPGPLRFRNEPQGARFATRTQGGNLFSGRAGGVSFRFTIKGGPELLRKLNQLDRAMSDAAMAQALLAGADVLATEWRHTVPVDEGHYRNSITATASPGRQGATARVWPDIVPGVPANEQPRLYATRLEFGSLRQTRRMLRRGQAAEPSRFRRPHPSLRPAFDNVHRLMVDTIAEELKDIIRRVVP